MTKCLYKITPEVSAPFYIRAESYSDAGFLALAYLTGFDKFFPEKPAARRYDARCVDGSQQKPGHWQAFDFSSFDTFVGEKIFVERVFFSPSAGVFVMVKPRVY